MQQRVMVTGAGGTIGKALVHKLEEDPSVSVIVALDNNEYNLYQLDQSTSTNKVLPLIADVRHTWLLDSILKENPVDVIYHAAALKHVPLLEIPHNSIEAMRTNIGGTKNVLDTAIRNKVCRFVLVSTDKAVKPTSLMGATKKYAEGYCLANAQRGTHVSIVRFGNVYGSPGSVVELFSTQINSGLGLSVTDPEMERYFISVEEATQLVVYTKNLQPGLFMLDMGKPIKIVDLAKKMMIDAGVDLPIYFIGIRPGEKLKEILKTPEESIAPTQIPKVLELKTLTDDYTDYLMTIHDLLTACDYRDLNQAIKIMKSCVDYTTEDA